MQASVHKPSLHSHMFNLSAAVKTIGISHAYPLFQRPILKFWTVSRYAKKNISLLVYRHMSVSYRFHTSRTQNANFWFLLRGKAICQKPSSGKHAYDQEYIINNLGHFSAPFNVWAITVFFTIAECDSSVIKLTRRQSWNKCYGLTFKRQRNNGKKALLSRDLAGTICIFNLMIVPRQNFHLEVYKIPLF